MILKKTILILMMIVSVGVSHAQFLWYENQTSTAYLEYTSTTSGTFFTAIANPETTGINTNTIVSKFNREEGTKELLELITPK